MAGKREHIRSGLRLPGILVILGVMAVLLTSAGPSGVAADSPVETFSAAEAVPAGPPAEAAPIQADTPPSPEDEAPEQAGGLVAESAPVEDDYFDDVAFLGDSRTEGFSLYSGLDTGTYFHAVGATVESVFTKDVETEQGKMPLLDALAEVDCGKIYVMLGVNELGWNGTEIFHDQFARVIDRLREDHPDAEVVLQSIIPVSARQEAKGTYVNNERIAAYNEVIEELAEEKGCPYLNVAEAVVDDAGCLRADWNFDGVHLNVAGCQAWLDYLRTHAVGEAPEHEHTAEQAGTGEEIEE